ncbi:MAG: hypothetical protein V2A66_00315 [Pseudomonadota bacterium]
MLNAKGILQRLLENDIDFVLVGGLAATMYGAATVTYDVDVCLDFSIGNIQKLLIALEDVRPRVRVQKKWRSLQELPLKQIADLKNLYLQTDCGGLDLLGSLTEIGGYEEARRHSTEITVFNRPCRILKIEDLLNIKERMDRPKDRQVVLELKAILEKQSRK